MLPLLVDGERQRKRLEKLFSAMHSIKCALQQDMRSRLRAYWASPRRPQQDPADWREELGLTRAAGAPRLPPPRTLRLAAGPRQQGAGPASSGRGLDRGGAAPARRRGRQAGGEPRLGSYWDFRRITGRARSHTTEHKWETFRLFGSLQGHLDAYRHLELPDEITSPEQAARLAPGSRVLAQPRHPRPPQRPASWWDYSGPLLRVFNGGPASRAGELVLPARLAQGAGRWPYLLHYLGCPERWHKVDLVRRRDASCQGGWAYEAHLMILGQGYCSPASRARRQAAAELQRVGGVDGNVSNLAVVSFPHSCSPAEGEVASTRVSLRPEEKARLAQKHRRDRARQRALGRSRRANNPQRYQLSQRQRKRAERRAAVGLHERQVMVPGGGRLLDARGRPQQPYREDLLSQGYRRRRGEQAEAAASFAQARSQRARRTAAAIVAVHGPRLTIEETNVSVWFRRWGRSCLAFTPAA